MQIYSQKDVNKKALRGARIAILGLVSKDCLIPVSRGPFTGSQG
jgi:hypothetical protein